MRIRTVEGKGIKAVKSQVVSKQNFSREQGKNYTAAKNENGKIKYTQK